MITLLQDYKKYEKIMGNVNENSEYINTTKYDFLAPTTLIPLLCMQNKLNIPILVNDSTEDYVKRIINGDSTNNNTPYQVLPKSAKERQDNELTEKMVNNIKEKWGDQFGGYFTLRYIISELTSNIYDHTSFEEELASQGYTYAQQYPNLNKLDICIMDDGLSIPGRFKKSGIPFEDECHAIELAISNNSTLSKNPLERGNGLWSTIKLAVEGNGAEVLIVSGKGCLHIKKKDKYKYFLLDNENIFKGTLISFKLNNREVQNCYGLIEMFTGNPYKYKVI